MKEIGSEFWDVPINDEVKNSIPERVHWFISGRSALLAIIKNLDKCHTVAMPSWCCESMVKPFIDSGMDVHFYPVYWNDGLIQEVDMHQDALFIMDYFGYTPSVQPDLSGYEGIVIRDITHSVFSTCYNDSDYYFGSLRKWCGIWTGGYALSPNGSALEIETTDDNGYALLREKGMQLKERYIFQNAQENTEGVNKEYLKIFETAEEKLDNLGIVSASKRDIILAQKIDVDWMKKKRRANAEILRTAFHDWLVFKEMASNDCPLFVPIIVPNGERDGLRKYLINNGVFCPIHWPMSDYYVSNDRTEYIYNNELSLVCDQRYMKDDMVKIVRLIHDYFSERRSIDADGIKIG